MGGCCVSRWTAGGEDAYQLKSDSSHGIPDWMAFPAMTISQSRMVLATTGMRPMEKMTMRAAGGRLVCCYLSGYVGYLLLWRLLNLSNGRRGRGYKSRITSVKTLMPP